MLILHVSCIYEAAASGPQSPLNIFLFVFYGEDWNEHWESMSKKLGHIVLTCD